MAIVPGIAAARKRIGVRRFLRPATIAQACAAAREPGTAFHAGGIDLVNALKAGREVDTLIALRGIAELRGVSLTADRLEIGAATTHREIETDSLIRRVLPGLADYVAGLGNIRIRGQGTIGGNLLAGEAGYEMAPLLAALDATLHFVDCASDQPSTRSILDAQPDGRLLVAISIPLRPRALIWKRDLRPALSFVATLERTGRYVSGGAGVIGGAGAITQRAALAFARPLSGAELIADAAGLARAWIESLPAVARLDGPGTPYCRHVAEILMRRSLVETANDAAA
jgi:CO/xanthine dehydrogenase FAD-binding subunit